MTEFQGKHFLAIFLIATLAVILSRKTVPLITGLPVVGPILAAI